ncbi:MAG: SpoIIE family protein phosphatase [Oscillospiraceae bacterium]
MGIKSETLKKSNVNRYKYLGTTAEVLTMMFVSFIIANSTISGVQSPLNVALMGSLPPIYAGAVLSGSLIAYFTSNNFLNSAVMICSMLLVAGVRIFINRYISNLYNALITTICMLCGGIVIFTATEQGTDAIGIHICLSIITGIVQYFITLLFYEDAHGFHINTDSMVSIAVAYVLLIATFCSIKVSYFNIGIVLSVLSVLCCAKIYGVVGSGICGILSTCGILLFSSNLGFATIFFAVSGLACGLLSEHNKIISGIFFISINLIGLLLIGDADMFTSSIGGILLGSVIFLVIPSRLLKLDTPTMILNNNTNVSNILDTIEARLKYSAQAIKEARRSTSGVANAIDKKFKPINLTDEVFNEVCLKCRNRSYCWEKNANQTRNGFETLETQEKVVVTEMPEVFNWCFKRLDISESFNRNIKRREMLLKNYKNSMEIRKNLYSQMDLAESIINSTMNNILVKYRPKTQVSEDVSYLLRENHVSYLSVSAYVNDLSKLFIEVYTEDENLGLADLESEISEVCEKSMEFLTINYIDGFYRTIFCEKKSYSMEIYTSQKVSKNYSVCGDTADNFTDCYSNQYAVISDGMGRGNSASIDSQLAVRLFKKLALTGMNIDIIANTINSLIMTKSSEESFATLDVLKLDTYSGTADIYKAGATCTIVKSRGNVKLIEGVSYPLGIMDNVQLYNYKLNLNVGDIIIMVSDGIDESMYQYIKTALTMGNCTDVSVLAQSICNTAFENSSGKYDDMTVTVIKIV